MFRHPKSRKKGHPILKILFVLIVIGMLSSLGEVLTSPRDNYAGNKSTKEDAQDTVSEEVPNASDASTSGRATEAIPLQLFMEVLDGNETLKCKAGETADPLELVQCSSDGQGDVEVKASVASIDLSRPHVEEVSYDVSATSEAGVVSKEQFVVAYQIVDDDCPTIDFGHKKISIEEGASFDPLRNINYVRDAVEGDAEYLISKPSGKTDYSWYTVDSQVDPDEPGIYKVYVHASDSSGNVKDREYQVTVNEKKVEPVKAAAPQGTDYVLNTNTYKFHYPWCSSVKKMKSKNRRDYYGTRDEVIQMGYDPCKNCDP